MTSMDDGPIDGATVWETAGWVIRQHETGRCPQCDGGGCWMVDWAAEVRTTDRKPLTAERTVKT